MVKSSQSLLQALTQAMNSGCFNTTEFLIATQGKIREHHFVSADPSLQPGVYFDLASLTKPFCTSLLYWLWFDRDEKILQKTLGDFFEEALHPEVTLASLLNHTSGLIDWYEFEDAEVAQKILTLPKFWKQNQNVCYSDLGYILLGAILEKQHRKSLAKIYKEELNSPLLPFFPTPSDSHTHFVPSEICTKRGRTICGEVMDENASVMGGVAGHAGLFGNAEALHSVLQEMQQAGLGQSQIFSQKAFECFTQVDTKRNLAKRFFTLGFDTPTHPHSQSGKKFSVNTIGHLGYSGTSFWWDLEKDVWMILLTNRCFPSRENKKLSVFRPKLHNLAWENLLSSSRT